MKNKRLIFGSLGSIIIALGCFAFITLKNPEKGQFQVRNLDNQYRYGIREAALWMYERKMDPATGEINWGVFEEATRLMTESNKFQTKDDVLNSIVWSDMGPNNVAGRARALLIDKDNNNIVYTGGIAGGLYKTVNGATTWARLNLITETGDTNVTSAVSCLAQDMDGYIYVGTGEGLTSGGYYTTNKTTAGMPGNGIYFSNAAGTKFTRVETPVVSGSNNFRNIQFINRIACAPQKSGDTVRIYLATDLGLKILKRVGDKFSWENPSPLITGMGCDVKIGKDGTILYSYKNASSRGNVSISKDNGKTFTSLMGTGKLPTNQGRIEVAIAPSDPNYIYAQVADVDGKFVGIYRSTDKGDNFTQIIMSSLTVDGIFGTGITNQGDYNNTIAVYPDNPNRFLSGGIDVWEGKLVGNVWAFDKISINMDLEGIFNYVHSDIHNILFDKPERFSSSNLLMIASDGGISKSTNAQVPHPQIKKFTTLNRNLVTAQFYAIACSNDSLRVSGGLQDVGSQLIDGNRNTGNPKKAEEIGGGDGGFSAFSMINTKAIFGSVYGGNIYRKPDLQSETQNAKNGEATTGWYSPEMQDIMKNAPQNLLLAPFVTPCIHWESVNDAASKDSVIFVASYNISAGTKIQVKSERNGYPMWRTMPRNLAAGDTIKFLDDVMSRFFAGLRTGVWMTTGAIDFGTSQPKWGKILDIGASNAIYCIAVSKDGNYMYAASGSTLYRVSGISNCISTDTSTWQYNSSNVKTTQATIWQASNMITSIAVDPQNPARVLVSLGTTGSGSKLYLSENATDDSPTFVSKYGNLPTLSDPNRSTLPIYATLIEMNNSNYAMIGSEPGIYFTKNLNDANPTWTPLNTGLGANVPVFHIIQQTHNIPGIYYTYREKGEEGSVFYPGTNNSGYIYIGTHGMGIYKTSAFYVKTLSNPTREYPNFNPQKNLLVYPNPASTHAHLEFELAKEENIKACIYDITGKLVKIIQIEAHQGDNTLQINCDDLKGGIYMINLTSKTVNLNSKLVVRK